MAMHNWFKKYFIPHQDNDFKPHLFREVSVMAIFSLAIILFIIAVSSRIILIRTNLTALVLPKVLVDYANEDRDLKNYNHLAINSTLEKAAQLKANDMAEKGYFAHKSPDGKTPWYWFKEAGYDFSYAGENLAVNFNDSVDVNTAWMNSPGHRANILNGNFSEIGIATAEGMYQGRRTVFVVQLFGRPAEKDFLAEQVAAPSNLQVKTPPKTAPKATTTQVAVATSSVVLSESAETKVLAENGTNELFISVEKKSVATTAGPDVKYSNFFEKAIVSPEKYLSIIYLVLAVIIVIVLLLAIFVETRLRHPRMIVLALGLLTVILGLLYIYKTILFAPLLIA